MSDECVVIKVRLREPAGKDHCRVELDVDYPSGSGSYESGMCTVEAARHYALFHDAEGTGRLLATGLLAGDVRRLFDAALGHAESHRWPVRVVLDIPTGRTGDGGAAAWYEEWHGRRWETLWYTARDRHLATDEKVYLSRYLRTDAAPFWRRPRANVRSLVAVANPPALEAELTVPWLYDPAPGAARPADRHLAPIVVARELERARAALGPLGRVEVLNETGRFTLPDLAAAVRAHLPDVLYLVAHGVLKPEGPRLFVGTSDKVLDCLCPGAELVKALDGLEHRPRMVVLVSCESAGKATGDEGLLASLGPMFVAAGVPAVLAMQGNVFMDTAAQFLPTFFEELRRDGRMDRAASVARHHAFLSRCPDFWAPVLFCRTSDGRLWDDPALPGRDEVSPALEHSGDIPNDRRKRLIKALIDLPSLQSNETFRRVLADAAGYRVVGPADRPSTRVDLAEAWLQHGDRLGALLDVLDHHEGPESRPLADLYELVQEATQLPVPWPDLAKLKRIFPADYEVPDRLVHEFRGRYPAFRPERSGDRRPAVRGWLEELAGHPRGPDGGGPLYDFLSLLRDRHALGDQSAELDAHGNITRYVDRPPDAPGNLAPAVAAWIGTTPAFRWPGAAAAAGAAGLTVAVRRGRPGKFAVRAWMHRGAETEPLTDPAAVEVRLADLRQRVPQLADEAARRAGPPAGRLRIEVFLPYDLLDLDVDDWPAADGPLGRVYRVAVRVYERAYELQTGERDAWLHRWGMRPQPGDRLPQAALCDSWNRLSNTAGPAVAAADPPDADHFAGLLEAGYPVAVLVRGPAPGGRDAALRDLVLGDPFDGLADRVRAARQTAAHPAGPVSLVWDDADRPPPDCRRGFTQPQRA